MFESTEILCNTINTFTVTFVQFNATLLNKKIKNNKYKYKNKNKNLLTPKLLIYYMNLFW